MSDSVPLLRSSSVTSRRCPYRFQFIHSKGALLVLFWDLMISFSQNLFVKFALPSVAFSDYYFFIRLSISFLYLIAGYFGDFLFSRYKVVLIGSYFTFVLLISYVIIFIIHFSLCTCTYLLLALFGLTWITITIVRVTLLPFNIDQLIGSSSDELTAIIHWHNLGFIIAISISVAIYSFHIEMLPLLLASAVCIAAVLVSHSLFKHYLDTAPVNTVNPLKLIVRVLCYARKHKYPENRSALTYWEEEAPSRLDLGKDKYGGPFTEEEVEDVKTVLRLIPLVVVCGVALALYEENAVGLRLEVYGCKYPDRLNLSFCITYVSIIFLHQFLVYPCFHKYIPSLLKRIGMGLLLIVLVNILYTGLAITGNYEFEQMFHCLTAFDNNPSTTSNLQWMIFTNIIDAVIWYMYIVVLVEFILAQCPKSMRGSIIGLWFCIWGLRSTVHFALLLPFLHYMSPEVALGRGFYHLLTQAIVSLLVFLIYIFLAKRYKLRVREVEINIHQIAEDHTINDIEQEEEYWRRNPIESFSSQSTDTMIIISQY
uniref:Major facilitator superfamily associated domain-containing protein n=1 Tax=Amphimedon queenslandica TaxID=400682 RepID=A0A1X7T236_AMPQE